MAAETDTLFDIHLRFPVRFTLVATTLVIGLTIAFYAASSSFTQTAIFLGAAAAAAGTIVMAFYTGRTLNLYISQRRTSADHEQALEARNKKERAIRYAERWNDPTMYHARDVVRCALDLRGKGEAEITAFVEERKTNVIHIFNFLEEVAFALEHRLVDHELLRNAFEGIVVGLWQVLEPWIAQHRTCRGRPKIWEQVEKLYVMWK